MTKTHVLALCVLTMIVAVWVLAGERQPKEQAPGSAVPAFAKDLQRRAGR